MPVTIRDPLPGHRSVLAPVVHLSPGSPDLAVSLPPGRQEFSLPKALNPVMPDVQKPNDKHRKPPPRVSNGKFAQFSTKADLFVEEPARIDAHVMMRGIIGAYTYIRQGSRLGAGVALVGRYCSFAPAVAIGDGQHPMDWLSTHPFQQGESFWLEGMAAQFTRPTKRETKPRTLVGNDVWIGANAIIMSGLVIGDGAVIAAGAIVTKHVPPYAVVAGVPARVIKYRFPEETIQRLQELSWWRYRAADLVNIPFEKVDAAIDEIRRRIDDGALQPYDPGTTRVTADTREVVTSDETLATLRKRNNAPAVNTAPKAPVHGHASKRAPPAADDAAGKALADARTKAGLKFW